MTERRCSGVQPEQIKTWDWGGGGRAGRAVSIWRQRQPTIITNNNSRNTVNTRAPVFSYLSNTHRTSHHYGVSHPGCPSDGGFVWCQLELFARKQRELSLLVGTGSSGEKQNSSNSAGTDSQTSANSLTLGAELQGINIIVGKIHF